MTEQDRLQQAQALLQVALQTIQQQYGMTLEPVLQVETISNSYATSRAAFLLKPMPGWQPPMESGNSDGASANVSVSA